MQNMVILFVLGCDVEPLKAWSEAQAYRVVGLFAVSHDQFALAWAQALEACQANHAQALMIDSPVSLALLSTDFSKSCQYLANQQIKLIFADTKLIFEPAHLDGLGLIFDTLSKFEKSQQSSRIKRSLQKLTAKGQTLGGRKFGSRAHEERVVRQVLQLYHQGFSLQAICQKLHDNNIKTVNDKQWHPTTLKRIIERHGPKAHTKS